MLAEIVEWLRPLCGDVGPSICLKPFPTRPPVPRTPAGKLAHELSGCKSGDSCDQKNSAYPLTFYATAVASRETKAGAFTNAPLCEWGRGRMSDTSQGPGWWIASDGKWYSPSQHPDYVPPDSPPPPVPTSDVAQPSPVTTSGPLPPTASVPSAAPLPPSSMLPPQAPVAVGYVGLPPSKKTNGLSIASLVLGILWFGGVGSVLAVVFGFLSRKKIEQSQGRETGGGLAVAGIVLGFVGIFGAIAFWIAIVTLGAAVDSAASYANGYSYGSSHYSASVSETSICNSSNVPSGNLSSSWIDGCRAAWNVNGVGNTGSSGNSGNTGSSGNSGNTGSSGNSGNTGAFGNSGNS